MSDAESPKGTLELSCEDCMALMARYPDKHFDLAIVDPPYGIERFKKGGSHLNKHGSENGQWNGKLCEHGRDGAPGKEQP